MTRTTPCLPHALLALAFTLAIGSAGTEARALTLDFEDPASQACFPPNSFCEFSTVTVEGYVFASLAGRHYIVSVASSRDNTTFQENGTTTFSSVGDAFRPFPVFSLRRADDALFRLPRLSWAAGNSPGAAFDVRFSGIGPSGRVDEVIQIVIPSPPDPFNVQPTDFWQTLVLPSSLANGAFTSYEIAPLGRLIRVHFDDIEVVETAAAPEPAVLGLLFVAASMAIAKRRHRRVA